MNQNMNSLQKEISFNEQYKKLVKTRKLKKINKRVTYKKYLSLWNKTRHK